MSAPPFPALTREITEAMVARYGQVNGDRNMLHYEAEAAAEAGYDTPIAHGALTAAVLSQACAQVFGARWLDHGHLKIRFRRPLAVGDSLTTGGSLEAEERRDEGTLATYRVWCRDGAGELVIDGTARALLSA